VKPALLTFDLFGTVVDWRTGLQQALGAPFVDATFERVIDAQAEDEQASFRPYAEIVARSLTRVLGLDPESASRIGERAGEWPVFPDARAAFARLLQTAPCGATTNSDLAHRPAIEKQLGAALDPWICAGEVGAYKPDPRIWDAARAATGVPFGPSWWHVSAYADYDLATARRLGLTCVLIRRPHHRAGTPDLVDLAFGDLGELAAHLD
jgi:2-haloalkanoic acid dehalogenase type II